MNNYNASQRHLVSVDNRQRYLFLDNKQYLNLSSNDYLGLSDVDLQREFLESVKPFDKFALSNPSSRLMTGNSFHYQELERSIAMLFKKEASLVLSSGYLVNSGLIGAIATSRDLIVADKLVHASMIDGIRLSGCDLQRFRHNDMNHLESILKSKRDRYDRVFILVESIYSMDGDIAPLLDIVRLKREYEATIYLDEAHAFGVRGARGCGVAEEFGVSDEIEIIVATLGKAAASQGGFVVCSGELKEVLVNKMRSLIFSTAISDVSLEWSKFIIDRMESFAPRREKLSQLCLMSSKMLSIESSQSHIFPYILGSSELAVQMQERLRSEGYYLNAIRYPTVAKGSERLRISLTAAMSSQEIERFWSVLLSVSKG